MGNFKFHKKTGSEKRYGRHDYGRPSFGRGRGDREMFEAICSTCGKTTTVPFRPNGRKPVFCDDCFKKSGGADDTRRAGFVKRPDYGRRPDFEKRSSSSPQYDAQIEMLNHKIDRLTDMVKTLLAEGKREIKPKTEKKLKNATPIEMPETVSVA